MHILPFNVFWKAETEYVELDFQSISVSQEFNKRTRVNPCSNSKEK